MPKTGSSTVRQCLEPYKEVPTVSFMETSEDQPYFEHMRPVDLVNAWDQDWQPIGDYRLFTVVRNPWARLVSLYNHLLRTRRFRWERRLGVVPRSFEHWLEHIDASGDGAGSKGNRYRMYGSYTVPAFCSDQSGGILVDEFVQLERLDSELPDLAARLGLEIAPIRQVNVRAHAPYREYYNARSRDLVAARYEWEIDRFGYEF